MAAVEPARSADELYEIIPEDHRQPYDVRNLLECLLDDGHLDEFQVDYAKEMITGHARICGIQIGVIANHRGMVRMPGGKPPRFGGIIYTSRPRKSPTSSRRANAMAGQGFDPDFIYRWPTGRMGVTEGDSAVQAVFWQSTLTAEMDKVRETYDMELDAKYAAARGFVDAVIKPEFTRQALELSLRTTQNYSGPHLGQFALPANLT